MISQLLKDRCLYSFPFLAQENQSFTHSYQEQSFHPWEKYWGEYLLLFLSSFLTYLSFSFFVYMCLWLISPTKSCTGQLYAHSSFILVPGTAFAFPEYLLEEVGMRRIKDVLQSAGSQTWLVMRNTWGTLETAGSWPVPET